MPLDNGLFSFVIILQSYFMSFMTLKHSFSPDKGEKVNLRRLMRLLILVYNLRTASLVGAETRDNVPLMTPLEGWLKMWQIIVQRHGWIYIELGIDVWSSSVQFSIHFVFGLKFFHRWIWIQSGFYMFLHLTFKFSSWNNEECLKIR